MLTCDPFEKYAVFVHRADAEAFSAEHPTWRVEWCVDSPQ